MIADGDGSLFCAFTIGWVPWSVLVGPDGRVIFSENEFDDSKRSNVPAAPVSKASTARRWKRSRIRSISRTRRSCSACVAVSS